jgi:pimeloyl-ACP methyl ester carboxylesterase
MSRFIRICLCGLILLVSTPLPASGSAAAGGCYDGDHALSEAVYRICMPAPEAWNGDLVVYAHGYVAPDQPVAIPEDQLELPDGTSIPGIVNQLGYAFATTSYATNGLAVKQGLADILELVDIFTAQEGQPGKVYLVGASEGSLITALGIEAYPQVFNGGVAACGPLGDFRQQINYWGDFRVVFDYLFPEYYLPNSPIDIDQSIWPDWETVYEPAISASLYARPQATSQLLQVTKAPVDPIDPATIADTVTGLLWYNLFATNDGVYKLGGNPFDNHRRWYWGSNNDLRLNRKVERFEADPAALAEVQAHYQTSGAIPTQLVSIHTTGDPIIPYWHVWLYRQKVYQSGSWSHYSNLPIFRYGHCNFKPAEVLAAFGLLVLKTSGLSLQNVDKVLSEPAALQEYQRLIESGGQSPGLFLPLVSR